jgi:hypothetical protein
MLGRLQNTISEVMPYEPLHDLADCVGLLLVLV